MPAEHLTQQEQVVTGNVSYGLVNGGARGTPISHLIRFVDYGVIALAVANGISATQSVGLGALALINGSLATAGVATFATPRNVVAAWTNTAIITITGTDEYGAAMVEISASGVAHTGKKAFKTITSILSNAAITGFTAGSGVVIGLPQRVDTNSLISRLMDGVLTTCTFVPAVLTDPATGITGDVRGTVNWVSAPDGTRTYALMYKIAGSATKLLAYGVDQFKI